LRDLIDATLSADAVKTFKPDPRVYELACDHFRIDKQQICFVSSNGWDAAGAACFGFRVAWLNRDKSARETLRPQPDVEINSLAQLADMLGV
jgi:2-haloacid dehalogenase